MDNFFAELRRRHIYRVAAAYAVVAWGLLQIVNNIAPLLRLPDWTGTFFLVLLVVGFPVALIFAWALELKSPGAAEQTATGGTDWILTAALALVMALMLYEEFVPRSGSRTTQLNLASGAGIAIAVLPFTNMSGDAGQEFFSDGMTEEITSALAKVPGLKVIGRTSAFQFKGQNQDLRSIGQALSAGYLIEGSVRKAGDQVRITAQLIKADDGTHLWTENYDRKLTNIFATQEDIAQAIAGSLRVPLGLRQGEALVSNRTVNVDSYQQYLRGKALMRAGYFEEAIKVFEPVVANDPNFAPAWAYLARANNGMPAFIQAVRSGSVDEARRIAQSYRSKGEMAAREAIRLDPKLPAGYWALATTMRPKGSHSAREDLYRQALALDANDPDVLNALSSLLGNAGRLKESLRMREQLRAQEPFVPVFNVFTAQYMRAAGEGDAAISILEGTRVADPVGNLFTNAYLAQAYAAEGRYAQAADTLLAVQGTNFVSRQSIEEAARLLRQAPTKVSAPNELPVWPDPLNWIYAHLGAPERMLEWNERTVEVDYQGINGAIWLSEYAALRKTERFKTLVRNAGLVGYWRERGWPDLCRAVGADDFTCD